MTRLTLHWHLRGIVEGTTVAECVRVDLDHYSEWSDRWWPGQRYYTDPNVEGYKQHESQSAANSYTTGFRQDCGEFCDAFSIRAHEALHAEDTVKYLDAVAHDPTKRHQERYDAAQLLDYHIWPDSPDAGSLGRGLQADRHDIDVREFLDAGMGRRSVGPTYMAMRCVNPDCSEGECLCDWDTLRDENRAECMVCGTEQPRPQYP